MTEWSKTKTWFKGSWLDGNPSIMGPRSHAAWLGSSVFDGARAFEGVMPDLDRHCERANASAITLGLKPTMRAEEIAEICREGHQQFNSDAVLYVRPMYWAESDGPMMVGPDASSTQFAACLYEAPFPTGPGFTATTTEFQRPTLASAPVNAKAGCLYPNNARMLKAAHDQGFQNALCCDALGNVAEFATSNAFMVKDDCVFTPAANGTFLNGITRQRVIKLLQTAGKKVVEATLTYDDFRSADEIFSTGNYAKVSAVIKFEDRNIQPGPIAAFAKELYWDFAHK